MKAQTTGTGAPHERTGPKHKEQISARKRHASERSSAKDAKLTHHPRPLRQAKVQNKRQDAALRERVNGKGRNQHGEQAANQHVTPGCVSERHGKGAGTPASSHAPQQGVQLRARLDDAIRANGAGPRWTHTNMLPMQAIAMAHWQFWATAMAVYPRAWISANSSWLDRRSAQG
jgi:hypothetical protein